MQLPFKFDLGVILKDVVTGFEGVVMGRTQYYTGCNHYGLVSQKLSDKGSPIDWEWLDESRLVETKKKQILLNQNKPTSGSFPNAPEN